MLRNDFYSRIVLFLEGFLLESLGNMSKVRLQVQRVGGYRVKAYIYEECNKHLHSCNKHLQTHCNTVCCSVMVGINGWIITWRKHEVKKLFIGELNIGVIWDLCGGELCGGDQPLVPHRFRFLPLKMLHPRNLPNAETQIPR